MFRMPSTVLMVCTQVDEGPNTFCHDFIVSVRLDTYIHAYWDLVSSRWLLHWAKHVLVLIIWSSPVFQALVVDLLWFTERILNAPSHALWNFRNSYVSLGFMINGKASLFCVLICRPTKYSSDVIQKFSDLLAFIYCRVVRWLFPLFYYLFYRHCAFF